MLHSNHRKTDGAGKRGEIDELPVPIARHGRCIDRANHFAVCPDKQIF